MSDEIENNALHQNYKPFNVNGLNLLIFEMFNTWEICLRTIGDDGYPQRIGYIGIGDSGSMNNCTDLSWSMKKDYRNVGIMKAALKLYVEKAPRAENGFCAKILKENIPSLKLARAVGFWEYDSDLDHVYFNCNK
jgi:RimJ/RimL family protein N-acetyltransferase